MSAADLYAITRRKHFDFVAINEVQSIVRQIAPQWTSDTSIFKWGRRRERIDWNSLGSLAKAATSEAKDAFLGIVEIRGASPSLILNLHMPHESRQHDVAEWGEINRVGFQILRKKIEGLPYHLWSNRMLSALAACGELQIDRGESCLSEEWKRDSTARIAVDESSDICKSRTPRGVLGVICWSTFFGEPYADMIGRDRLLSAPAYEAKELGKGVLLLLSEKPEEWNTSEYKARKQRVLDHVGREYFYEHDNPNKPVKSPFNLPLLPLRDPNKVLSVLHKGGGKFEVLDVELRGKDGLPPLDENTRERFGLRPEEP